VAIAAPAKDDQGNVLPHDHPELTNDGRLIRRVPVQWVIETPAGRRLSSAVLEPSSKDVDPHCGLSVDLEQLMLAEGVDPLEHVNKSHPAGALAFRVSAFREQYFQVGFDPVPENDYHGGVWQRPPLGAKFTRGMKRKLLRGAEWFIAIEGVSIVDA